jgi:hypothetical protein
MRWFEAKHGRENDGNGMERIGRKHFESRQIAAASGGSGISGCGAGGNGTVQRDRAVRMQFLAVGGGWEILLHGATESFQLRGRNLYAQYFFVGGARK